MAKYDKLYAEQDDVCGAPFAAFVAFFEALEPGKRVLDLGCGQGRDALMAARHGHRVLGVDVSPNGVAQMVAKARTEGLDVEGVVGDIAAFKAEEAFDVVVIDRVLHMLPDDAARREVLEGLGRCTAPGSAVLIADTPRNLPMIRQTMVELGWSSTLARKGHLFWRRPLGSV